MMLQSSGALGLALMLNDSYFGNEATASPTVPLGSPITWVYRSHLNFFKYSTSSWRKRHNRPVDIDLQLRLYRAGVRVGHFPHPTASIGLRGDMTTWGSTAFLEEESRDEN